MGQGKKLNSETNKVGGSLSHLWKFLRGGVSSPQNWKIQGGGGSKVTFRQQGFETNRLQNSFNKLWCSPEGDEISNPGLNCTIVSLHCLFITWILFHSISYQGLQLHLIIKVLYFCITDGITKTYQFILSSHTKKTLKNVHS